MKILTKAFFICLLFVSTLGNGLLAQSGSKYSVRFNAPDFERISPTECIFTFQLEVKAMEGEAPFFISDQNYRFSFERATLANPRIIQELEVSGSIFVPGESSAFYDPHHINGSLDTIVSYNVVLAGGSGLLIDDARWYPVGRMAFDVVGDGCFDLKWHTHDPVDFPPTFIGEKEANTLFQVAEGSYDDFNTLCVNCPLPVELTSFEATDRGCSVELEWTTETETNNEFFRIEKSLDGVRWISIGQIAGAGTTTEPQSYSFIDEQITAISNYYRIRQVDYNQESTTSESKTVRSSCYNEQISIGITEVYPNPVVNDDRVIIKFYTERDAEATLYVTDELGRQVLKIPTTITEGANQLSFKAGSLASGVYFVQVRGEDWFSVVQKLIKIQD